MLIDPGKWGLCLCVVLTYPEATPKGGFDGRMTRRQYSLPHSPREIETAPGVDRDVTRDRKRVCAHDLRPRLAQGHAPRISALGNGSRLVGAHTGSTGCRGGKTREAARSNTTATPRVHKNAHLSLSLTLL